MATTTQQLPRGIRNNNPLNIRRSTQRWLGKCLDGTDPSFEQFTSLEYGLRAGFVILRTYMRRYRLATITQIISRWAPATENDTAAYIEAVARLSGIRPNERLDYNRKNVMCRLVSAMCQVENGCPVSFGRIENAYAMAARPILNPDRL